MKKTSLPTIAGACFLGKALFSLIIRFLSGNFSIEFLLYFIGSILIAVSLFISLPILMSIGAGISAIIELKYSLIWEIHWYKLSPEYSSKSYILAGLLIVMFWIILIVIGINQKKAKQLSFLAGANIILYFLLTAIGNQFSELPLRIDFYTVLDLLLMMIGTIIAGISYEYITTNPAVNTASPTDEAVTVSPAESKVDRLIQLKTLLDSGVISQEEFDAKKHQILGH